MEENQILILAITDLYLLRDGIKKVRGNLDDLFCAELTREEQFGALLQ